MNKLTLFLGMFLASSAVMAQDNITNKSSFFVGVDINDVMVDSDSIDYSYNAYTQNRVFSPSIDDSDINFSLGFGYKYYVPETQFFVMPRITYDFGKLKVDGDDGIETTTGTYPTFTEEEWDSHFDLEITPTYGFDVSFGYQINSSNELYIGVGLKNVDYKGSLYNTYKKEEENEATDTEKVIEDKTFDIYEISKDSKIIYPFSIGYIYNWKNMSFDLGYSYASFDVDGLDIKDSTLKLGAKYMF